MSRRSAAAFSAAVAAVVLSATQAPTVHAHSFTEPYLLPVPFWLYVYACAATLVLTFAVLGYFLGSAHNVRMRRVMPLAFGPPLEAVGRTLLAIGRVAALACLAI